MNYNKNTSGRITGNEAAARERINLLIEEGIKFNELIIAAGPGFGKTQSVVSFLEQSSNLGVWFALTELDNLPSRFWANLTFVVSQHRSELGSQLKELGFPDTLYKFEKFLQCLTKELYKDNQFVLFIFDDFHFIRDESVLRFFRHLASAGLENNCLVFLTRNTEMYSFEKNVCMITSEELQFTKEECAEYFGHQSTHQFSEDETDRLYSYTGGWPLAVYLVALEMKNHEIDWDERFFNSQKMIFRLIESEIFSSYNEHERSFFILLSVLNFFPRELLRMFAEDSRIDIDRLMQKNAFVIYDLKADSYYLHQIFIDFLEQKQHVLSSDSKNDILSGAAFWCLENSYPADAADYFYRCGRFDMLWNVIENIEGTRCPRDEASFFIKYIELMPEEYLHENPMRRIIYAMLLLNNLEIEKSKEQMHIASEQAESSKDSPENMRLRGEVYAALGMISFGEETLDFAEYFKKASEMLPDGSSLWKKDLSLVEHSSALNISGPEPGALEKSVDTFVQAMPYVSKVLNGAGYGLEHLASADAEFLTGNMKQALKDAYKALYTAQEKQLDDIADNALSLLLRIYVINGDYKNITETLQRLDERKETVPDSSRSADIAAGWFYSEIGETSRISGWIKYSQLENMTPISVDKELLLRARCLISERKYYESTALLDFLEGVYKKKNSLISMIYAHVYRAAAYYQTNEKDTAIDCFKAAYDLAFGNNLIMPFIEFGHKTRPMLSFAARMNIRGVSEEWLSSVLAKASTYAKRNSYITSQFKKRNKDSSPDFGLTNREVTLLQNLSQGLTREEIADSMFVSPHTVKSMLKTVYSKIGAINNADAVRIATVSDIL